MAVRNEGHWEPWLKFFLRGVIEVSRSATATAHAVLDLQREHRQIILEKVNNAALGIRLLDVLLQRPLLNVRAAEAQLDCAYVTAAKLIEQLTALGLLRETTGGQRNRQYEYAPYLRLFESLAT